VLKPSFSAGAYRTFRVGVETAATHQAELDAILARSGALLQPFLPEIAAEGGGSLLYFGREPSPPVLKTPKPRAFPLRARFGGASRAVEAPEALWRAAAAVIARLPAAPLYVRIDGVRHGADFLLMEVEALEPYLFLPCDPGAALRFARALAQLVHLPPA